MARSGGGRIFQNPHSSKRNKKGDKGSMGSPRLWLFHSLVVAAAALMVVSFTQVWWACNISLLPVENVVRIYPYGLKHDLGSFASYIVGAEPPFLLTVAAWVFLAVSIGLLLYSIWLKVKWGKLLVGGVGLAYIGFAVIATIYAAIRTGDYGMSLLGPGYISMGPEMGTGVDATLRFGYFMAYGVGLLCIALALLRDKITGKPSN